MRISNDVLVYIFIGVIAVTLVNANFLVKIADNTIKGMTGKAGSNNTQETGLVTLNLSISELLCPDSINIEINQTDNQSIILNWSPAIQGPDYYEIFISSNLSAIKNLNENSTPYTTTTNTSWTDLNADQARVRYYMVSPVKGSFENRNCTIVGKCTLYLVTGNNLFSLCMNKTYTAQSFMTGIPWTVYRPSVLKLDRPDVMTELWTSRVRGFGGDFDLFGGKGYYVTLDHYQNYTIAGLPWSEPFTLQLITGNNLIGIDGNRDFTAQSLMSPINWTTYRPSMLKLDRPDALTEVWTAVVKGFGGDFDIELGVGYYLTLDHNENHTLN